MNLLNLIPIVLACLFVLFLAIISIRAGLDKKKRYTRDDLPRKNVDEKKLDEYVSTLQKMIRCKTVYTDNFENEKEYQKFRDVIKEEFPLLHEKAELQIFGNGCLIYKIAGKNPIKNIMLMSHHDVVEGQGDWKYPPFAGDVAEGALWGRGTIDTKTPLFAEMQATEELLRENYQFEGFNLYIGSSHNEEVCGDGIPIALEYFKKNNIHFDTVVDEGGAITGGLMPGVKNKSAMVAVHEKGRHSFECVAKTRDSGHVGLNPSKESTVARMCSFVSEVTKTKLFKKSFAPEVATTFKKHAPYMPFALRLVFSNFKIFQPLLKIVMPMISPQAGGMLSTNMNFNKIEGGNLPQIKAKEVYATAYFRCVREETLRKELEKFYAIAKKYDIEVKETVTDYCKPTDYTSDVYKTFEKVIKTNFPDVIVSPFLLIAGTDARHLTDIADNILRFAPIDLNKQQFAAIHNPNENIGIANIGECVCFYKDFIKEM